VDWDGQGHRTTVTVIGIYCQYFYPEMVIDVGVTVVTNVRNHWSQKAYSPSRTHAYVCGMGFGLGSFASSILSIFCFDGII
jgi:hypothetical protein